MVVDSNLMSGNVTIELNLKKHPYLIDVPVLLIFFVRPDKLSQVFEQIRKVKPSKLYLYQDGPRKNRPDDIDNIKKCRDIFDGINWNCEVHTLYQKFNVGCDPSEFIAQKWMFQTEEVGIVLEDDDVPSLSFFPYCKELLEKYKDDHRIHMICGMNNVGVSEDVDDSYFFSKKGSIWGWASWRRVIDTWDENYTFLDDNKICTFLKDAEDSKKNYRDFIEICKKHKATGRAHYESINGASRRLYGRINIVPKYNMISNIGVDCETTHSVDKLEKLPKSIQKLLYMETYEISLPLKHPLYILQNKNFENAMTFSRLKIFFNRVEGLIRRFLFR